MDLKNMVINYSTISDKTVIVNFSIDGKKYEFNLEYYKRKSPNPYMSQEEYESLFYIEEVTRHENGDIEVAGRKIRMDDSQTARVDKRVFLDERNLVEGKTEDGKSFCKEEMVPLYEIVDFRVEKDGDNWFKGICDVRVLDKKSKEVSYSGEKIIEVNMFFYGYNVFDLLLDCLKNLEEYAIVDEETPIEAEVVEETK